MKPKTCNLDEHHGPQVGAADVQGGFYVEGINGVISNDRDLASGKSADDGTWEAGRYYPDGQTESRQCGMWGYCSTPELWDAAASTWLPGATYWCTAGCPTGPMSTIRHTLPAHTCAAIRFEYAPDSGSTVYELPNQEALDACDFSGAILRGDEAAGSPHFDILIDYDHEQTVYFFASWLGCMDGQKVAVEVADYDSFFKTCEQMGADSSKRIKSCDCNHGINPSTLIDPCHTASVYGCLRNMPDDLSCCPDPDVVAAGGVTYQRSGMSGSYVNATGGSDGVGTCIPKSDAPPPGDTLPPPPMSFVDDEGVQHTWTQAKPTIIVSAFDAIALMHMGMDSSQILGTYGTRGTSGSNANGYCECPPFEPSTHLQTD